MGKGEQVSVDYYIKETKLDNMDYNGVIKPQLQTWDKLFIFTKDEYDQHGISVVDKECSDYVLANNVSALEGLVIRWTRSYKDKKNALSTQGDFWDINKDNQSGVCVDLAMNILAEFVEDYTTIYKKKDIKKGEVNCFKLGSAPQSYVGDELNKKLESEWANNNSSFVPTERAFVSAEGERTELSYKGEKYVRVHVQQNSLLISYKNGEKIRDGSYQWFKVEPIEWEVLRKENSFLLVTPTNFLLSGMTHDLWKNSPIRSYLNSYNAEQTEIKHGFLDNIFGTIKVEKKIEMKKEQEIKGKRTRLAQLNPDTLDERERSNMTDTELIKMWIDSGQSVLLRGPSGIGKTERIKTLYPNLIYIKLTNGMFPEKVVGSMNLQTGQSIPPSFATEAILSQATDEEREIVEKNIQNIYKVADEVYERSKNSDEKVVILLDELLNVKPVVQSLVYTLVLNKIIETGKGLKLPANVVVVATGNQKRYSSVAEDLVEPLEKRFDHILDMEPNVEEWLYGYAIPNKVHPSVIGYICLKMTTSRKDMGYFYEEPEVGEKKIDKNGSRGKTNDPRGWVSVSNALYAFEKDLKAGKYVGKNVEVALQKTLDTKIRDEWASEFFDFYNNPVLTVDQVISGNYSQTDLPTTINERFATIASLLTANEEQFEVCRKFIRDYCNPEMQVTYDTMWAGTDENRLELIEELENKVLGSRPTYVFDTDGIDEGREN